jgi:hypothetical protein
MTKWSLCSLALVLHVSATTAAENLQIPTGDYQGVETTTFAHKVLFLREDGSGGLVTAHMSAAFSNPSRQTFTADAVNCSALRCTIRLAQSEVLLTPDVADGWHVIESFKNEAGEHVLSEPYRLSTVATAPVAVRFVERNRDKVLQLQKQTEKKSALYLGVIDSGSSLKTVALFEHADGTFELENYATDRVVSVPHEKHALTGDVNGFELVPENALFKLRLHKIGSRLIGHQLFQQANGEVLDLQPAQFVRVQLTH